MAVERTGQDLSDAREEEGFKNKLWCLSVCNVPSSHQSCLLREPEWPLFWWTISSWKCCAGIKDWICI